MDGTRKNTYLCDDDGKRSPGTYSKFEFLKGRYLAARAKALADLRVAKSGSASSHSDASMDLPSTRELELEALVKQRDAQLAILTVRLCFSSRPL